jgi:hypothetical protein
VIAPTSPALTAHVPTSPFPLSVLIPGFAFCLGAAILAQCAFASAAPAGFPPGSLCGVGSGIAQPFPRSLVMNLGMALMMLPGARPLWYLAAEPTAQPPAILRLMAGYCIPWAIFVVLLSLAAAMLARPLSPAMPLWLLGPAALLSLALHRLGTAERPVRRQCQATLRDGAWLGGCYLCANLIPVAAMAAFDMSRLGSLPLVAAMVVGQFAPKKISAALMPLSLIATGLISA